MKLTAYKCPECGMKIQMEESLLFINDEVKVVNVSIKGKQDFGKYYCFDCGYKQ